MVVIGGRHSDNHPICKFIREALKVDISINIDEVNGEVVGNIHYLGRYRGNWHICVALERVDHAWVDRDSVR